MKKGLSILVSILSISLSSCIFFKTDEEEYKTPDLFFKQAETWECGREYTSSKEGYNKKYRDCDGVLLQELEKIKEYESISNIDNKSEIYFTYENWVPATSGPNIARMTIFENGYLEIYRKQSLGKHHYFYFSIDQDLAYNLNRFTENLIISYMEGEELM